MPRIKKSLQQLVGKTIKNIVICKNSETEPKGQLFLVFDDGTSFEFWVNHDLFSMASKVDDEDLDQVVELANRRAGTVVQVIESPIAELGRERIEREPEAATNNPLDHIPSAAIDEMYAIFLAAHRRDALLYRMAKPMTDTEVFQWAGLFCRAFEYVLRVYWPEEPSIVSMPVDTARWDEVVQPPSVLFGELTIFLGGLSIVNEKLHLLLRSCSSVETFLDLYGTEFFENGESQGLEVLRILHAQST